MSFLDLLRDKSSENNSIVCFGLDPDLEKIPIKGNPETVISKFYLDILEAMKNEDAWVSIVKPNIAFYEQYGFEGLRALKKIIEGFKNAGIPVILDAKRGDIGKTSTAYAKALFNFWQADAITVAPYMGSDSVMPFIEFCKNGKGVYILNRTSNKGAKDLQDLKVNGAPIYMEVAKKIAEWHIDGVGAVVGATYPEELRMISEFYAKSGKKVSMLIPGVGSQGGSATDVVNALRNTGNELSIHRINSSSGISYAYIEQKTTDYAGAAVKEIKKLNNEIGEIK